MVNSPLEKNYSGLILVSYFWPNNTIILDYMVYNEDLKKINQLRIKRHSNSWQSLMQSLLKAGDESFSNEASTEQLVSWHQVTQYPQAIISSD